MKTNNDDAPKKVPILLENIGVNYLNYSINNNVTEDYLGKAILFNIYYEDNPNKANIYINKYKAKDKTFDQSNISKIML